MPDLDYNSVAEPAYGKEGAEAASSDQYQAMRRQYDQYFHVTHDQLGLASTAQTEPLKKWIDSIAPSDTKKIQEADTWFRLDYSKKMEAALDLYHGDFLPPLQRAVSAGVISGGSFKEWIAWVKDKGRDYKEKELSIVRVLPDYLEKRYALAAKKDGILRDARFAGLENSTDPSLKSLAAKLSDPSYFQDALEFEGRKKLIVEVLNALPIAESQKVLFAGFEANLDAAVKEGLISAGSKKKWIARFNDPSVTPKAKEYFVKSQFPSYVTAWKKVHTERSTILKDPIFAKLTDKDFKKLSNFKDDAAFLGLHFDIKEGMVGEARAAIKAHTEHKLLLHTETKSALQAAAAAGYISSNKIGAWTEHVLNGERTLDEMKAYMKDWAKVRHRYDSVELKMLKGRVPQGLQRLSEEKFLGLSYQQRLSYVNEAERRLHIEVSDPKDTPIQDAKGKVRHALDLENWDEAQYFLGLAWPLAQTVEDTAELQSMQKHLKAFSRKSDVELNQENTAKDVAWARAEIDAVMEQLPPSYQKMYTKALGYGAACLQCVTTCVYNRTWCEERGYLDEGMEDRLRTQSISETEHRLSHIGGGHSDGYENNFVDGFNQPSIRPKGIGPQNVFSSGGGSDAFVEQANANKNTWSFWYWTNYIDKDVSSGKNAYVAYALNHKIKRAARVLDKHGMTYSPSVGPLSSLN